MSTTHTEKSLNAMKLPELWRVFTETTGKETKAPNKKWLIGRILHFQKEEVAEEPSDADVRSMDEDLQSRSEAEERAADDAEPVTPNLSKMSLDELLAEYARVIGRPTGSTDRAYLIWKVREGLKGRVTVGAIPRSGGVSGGDVQVVSIRVGADFLARLDAAVKLAKYASRNAFIQDAITDSIAGAHHIATAPADQPHA